MDAVLTGIVSYAKPGDGKFKYPTDVKRTKQSTDMMRRAEDNLDLFWNEFDSNWKKLRGKVSSTVWETTSQERGKLTSKERHLG